MTRCRIFRCLMLGTALAVAALAVACDDPGTGPVPSLTPTPTTAASPAHTPTGVPVAVEPSRAPTPTSSSSAPMPTATSTRGPTPSPTAIEPAPTTTAPPSPEPTLQERIEGLFSDYRDNAPFDDHLRKLSDYQSPTPEAISSFETLAAHARQDFELTKRAVIAAGFLGLDSSEANLAIDAYLKHQQKYDLQDPTGFASVTDLILFQNHLNTPGTIGLPDGSEEDRRSYVLSSEERIETLIAGADIWSWLALPERDLATVPEWVKQAYPNNFEVESGRFWMFKGPFSLNASSDIRYSASPWYTDDVAYQENTIHGRRSFDPDIYSAYEKLHPVRQQWLNGLEFQANSTAVDLDALASGNLEGTAMYYSLERAYSDIARNRLDFILAYKSEFIASLDPRTRAFVDDTGDLSVAFVRVNFDKSIFVRVIDAHGSGAFRTLGIYDPLSDRPFFPVQDNENIILYVMGNTFRYNERVTPNELGDGRIAFDPEAWGVMYVTPEGRDPGGDFAASADYTVDKNGRRFTFGVTLPCY